ncbi:SusD/RagB family nutrient-binding outer membrane lipoprotein [Mongoliitalea lutea]|uniref:Starch-binding associating with outer membrane n=1 Tax=Mongoliitalea lutea TaxID=849756 RepID=A0A8J3D0W5_9BACT|nr:SusD/RagB family nutrient-binding outer membrane lipoprotein [Mongoliitalea lutea]GHB49525.1 hypothetical protein GCM10008106_32810 [Mongoliitalea lutea]
MKNYIIILVILLMTACDADFTNINTNPVVSVSVQPEFLLRKVLFEYSENASYEGFVAGNLLAQYFMAVDFNLFDRHGLTQPQYGGNPWPFLYENLRDNEILLQLSRQNPTFAIYEGPALVIKAMLFANLTDLYGDVPYSEALKGKSSGVVFPAYDSQEEIYLGEEGLLMLLTLASEKLRLSYGPNRLIGDVIYNGNLQNWLSLAESLRFKLLMRISGKVDVREQLSKLVQDGYLIINPESNAVFRFTSAQPNNFRMSTARIGDFNLFLMSETIQRQLERFNDPRVGVYFRPSANGENQFRGLRNGQDASQLSISIADFSLSGRIFREAAGSMKFPWLTSFELKFLMAEAAHKGFVQLDASVLYQEAVKEAFEYWGVAVPSNYLVHGPASFDSAEDKLELIGTQKWLSMPVNFYEGWIEQRRTGFPLLLPLVASLNDGLMPNRLPYPASEIALNNQNFLVASGNTNGNSINAKVWWAQ